MPQDQAPPLFQLMKEIGIIEQLSRNRLDRILPDGLTASQFTLLNHLARLGGDWSPVRLASAFQVTKGAMTNTVGKLATKGYVSVSPDPKDQRAKLVHITEDGLDVRNACIGALAPLMDELSGVISPQELDIILPILERVRHHLDANRT